MFRPTRASPLAAIHVLFRRMTRERVTKLHLTDFLTTGSCHVARARYRPGESMRVHGHDFAELFWIESGAGVHVLAPGQVDLRAGFVALMGPDDRHGLRAGWSGDLMLVNVAFAARHLDRLVADYSSECTALELLRGRGARVGPATLDRLRAAFAELSSGAVRVLDLHRFLLAVLSAVQADLDAHERDRDMPVWLARATAIASTDSETLAAGVSGLARVAGRSEDHLNRTCRRCLGITASGLLNRLRLDRAEALLRTTHHDVTEVAYESGFGNLSYFFRLFRERHGVSPGRYRGLAQVPVRGNAS